MCIAFRVCVFCVLIVVDDLDHLAAARARARVCLRDDRDRDVFIVLVCVFVARARFSFSCPHRPAILLFIILRLSIQFIACVGAQFVCLRKRRKKKDTKNGVYDVRHFSKLLRSISWGSS